MTCRLLEYPMLNRCGNVYAFSTTRTGGVSTGSYASMNCTPYTGDDPQCVRRNQEILLDSLPQRPQELVIPYQTHGTEVLSINEAYLSATPDERHQMLQGIDALVTNRPGVCLCISTADCIPILLYDKKHRSTAAIHAGWRGTAELISLRTVERMHALYGTETRDVTACIGPGISLDAYEVGEEVFQQIYDAFQKAGVSADSISLLADHYPATGKYHIDLPRANHLLLQYCGIPHSQIEDCGICTYTRCEEYFSARRLGIRSGRILSGILIKHP